MDEQTPDLIQGTEPATDETTVVPGAAEPEAEPVETEPDAPGDETPEPEPPKPSGFEKRISKLTYQAREAERQAAYWRGIAEGKGGATPIPASAGTAGGLEPTATEGPPKQEQFETYDEYLRALTRHEISTTMAQERKKLTGELEARELQGGFEKRVEAFRETHADFDEVAFSDDHQVSPTMRDAIVNTQDGAEIAYWLGKNPEESNRIARLSPNHQILELGRISARLAARPPAPPPRPASAAPAPITPVKAGGKAVEGLRDDLPIEEWQRRRNKEARNRA
jgi:hypothetical protein